MNNISTETKNQKTVSRSALLRSILAEIHMLRNELALLLPSEDVSDYAHATRIKKSYEKALKQYPPAATWR